MPRKDTFRVTPDAKYFRLLYAFENLVREFIDTTFKDAGDGDNWFDKRGSVDMKKKLPTGKRVKKTISGM